MTLPPLPEVAAPAEAPENTRWQLMRVLDEPLRAPTLPAAPELDSAPLVAAEAADPGAADARTLEAYLRAERNHHFHGLNGIVVGTLLAACLLSLLATIRLAQHLGLF